MRLALTLLALTLLSALGGCSGGDNTPPGEDSAHALLIDGRVERYRLYVPGRAQSANEPLPLLIALHGGGVNAASMDELTDLKALADRKGFLYMRPQGYDAENRGFQTWNAGSCCGEAEAAGIDHVAVIDTMIDDVAAQFDVDPARIYVTGHSNGGMMAYRLACQLSDRIAAIAPNSSYQMDKDYDRLLQPTVYACQPSRPVPVLHMHGLADTCAPFEGGQSTGIEGGERPPVADSIDFWVGNNRCSSGPVETYRNGDSRCVTYSGCEDGADVVLCTTDSAGHVWPGSLKLGAEGVCGGQTTTHLDANTTLWQFFEQHPKP